MKTYTVLVEQEVEVTIDETKFTEEFLAEFRESFYQFDRIQEHVEHLAQLYARGIADDGPLDFIEGYGPPKEFGIKFKSSYFDTRMVT